MMDTDVAWFAGVFEGEGCIEISKRSTVRLSIGMTDRDIIDRIHALFPGTISTRPDMRPVKAHYSQPRPIFVWRMSTGADVARILNLILPWLGERRAAKAREAITHVDNRRKPWGARTTHCKNGHELAGENVYRRPEEGKYIRCRTCYNDYAREYQRRKRLAEYEHASD